MPILFLGGHTLDMVYALPALPGENTKAKAERTYTSAGGPALNAAITCAILGEATVYAGALGEGPFTDAVIGEAERYGVRPIPLGACETDAPCASVALTPGGGRTIWAPAQAQAPEGALDALPGPQGFEALLVDGQLPDAAIAAARQGASVGLVSAVAGEAAQLYGRMGPAQEISGGSAANTIAGFGMLGGRAAYVGKVKDDQLGAIFAHDIQSLGVTYETPKASKTSANSTPT